MIITNGLPFRNVKLCGKCGLNHYKQEKCCAEKARCNKCNRTGHFARACLRSAVRQKSDRSKQRDLERMTAFIKRKTTECTLPFYSVEDAYFHHNITNSSVSQVSAAEFQQLKSLNDSLTKTIKGLKSENASLVLKNRRLKDFNEQLQNEVSLKKSEKRHLKETTSREINSLKEEIKTATPKLEIMDRLIEEFNKLNDDYEKLRIMQCETANDAMMMESMKNDQIDDLKTEISHLKSELAHHKEKTKYLCRKSGNETENPHPNPSKARWRDEFSQEWRGGRSYHGRYQRRRSQGNRNERN